jgi:hypothetical protein
MTDEEKMLPKVKADWVAALRSGKYAQCQGVLKRDEGYCCLGVLVEICPSLDTDGEHYITQATAEPLGLAFEEQDKLACMNDSDCSFAEIADYIEANL